MSAEIVTRVRRIRAALGALADEQVEVLHTGTATGGISDERLVNLAHMVIENVASLGNHLRRWAERSGKDFKRVDEVVRASLPLAVVVDLWNLEKHGPRRDGGFSGRSPRLKGIVRGVLLGRGRGLRLELTDEGIKALPGSPPLVVEVYGWIVDAADAEIGTLRDVLDGAVQAWEALMTEWGISVEPIGTR